MNITLVGMAGVGKSAIGRELAKRMNYRYVDTDAQIEEKTKLTLQRILDDFGDDKFTEIEERVVLELGKVDGHIISPGGSVVYSEKAMRFLKENSVVVFLNAPFEGIQKRLANTQMRGIVGLKKKSLRSLFDERLILYKRYADVQIDTSEETDISSVVEEIVRRVVCRQE
jgi:shikimate kinase